jgi:hypothetical protein
MLQLKWLGDPFSNVNLRLQTVDASVRFIGDHQNTANAASTTFLFVSDEMLTFYLQQKEQDRDQFYSLKQWKHLLQHGLKHWHYLPPCVYLPQLEVYKSMAQKAHYLGWLEEAKR